MTCYKSDMDHFNTIYHWMNICHNWAIHKFISNKLLIVYIIYQVAYNKQEQSEGLQSLAGRISHVYKLYIYLGKCDSSHFQ